MDSFYEATNQESSLKITPKNSEGGKISDRKSRKWQKMDFQWEKKTEFEEVLEIIPLKWYQTYLKHFLKKTGIK